MQRIEEENDAVTLTVIISVFNEGRTLDEMLQRVLAVPIEKELIIVNDASTDGTSSVLQQWASRPNVRVLTHEINQGKGASVRTALPHAKGIYTIIQDADLEYSPDEYPLLLEPLISGQAKVVYGSRYTWQRLSTDHLRLYRYGVFALNWFARYLYRISLSDIFTCYKVMPTKLLKILNLQCQRFELCIEITAKLSRMNIPITEVPINYNPRSMSEGKKIRIRDGIEAIQTLWRWRNWHAVSKCGFEAEPSSMSRNTSELPLSSVK